MKSEVGQKVSKRGDLAKLPKDQIYSTLFLPEIYWVKCFVFLHIPTQRIWPKGNILPYFLSKFWVPTLPRSWSEPRSNVIFFEMEVVNLIDQIDSPTPNWLQMHIISFLTLTWKRNTTNQPKIRRTFQIWRELSSSSFGFLTIEQYADPKVKSKLPNWLQQAQLNQE